MNLLEAQLKKIITEAPGGMVKGGICFRSGSLVNGAIQIVQQSGDSTLFEIAHPAMVEDADGKKVPSIVSFFFTFDDVERLLTFTPLAQQMVQPISNGIIIPS